jgi:hypothetical protein
MAKSTASEKQEPQEEQRQLVAVVPDFIDPSDMDGGFEGTDKDSFAIPFIQILQKMSPMVDEDNPKHIEGAKAGMLYNTVTQRLYEGKTGLTFIPCAYKRCFIQWGGRESDSGFKGEFTPEEIEAMKDRGEIVAVEGRLYKPDAEGKVHEKKSDYFADTRSHFILLWNEETGETSQAILSLSSTQTKASKMLMTSLQQQKMLVGGVKRTPPTYVNKVKLTTIGMANEKGTWSGARFDLEGFVGDRHVFEEAKAFWRAIAAGEVKVDYAKAENAATGNVADEPQEAEKF